MSGYLGAAPGFIEGGVLVEKGGLALHASEILGDGLAFVGAILWALFSNLRRHEQFDAIASLTTICLGASLLCGVWWTATDAH